jgi:hypothetical protein
MSIGRPEPFPVTPNGPHVQSASRHVRRLRPHALFRRVGTSDEKGVAVDDIAKTCSYVAMEDAASERLDGTASERLDGTASERLDESDASHEPYPSGAEDDPDDDLEDVTDVHDLRVPMRVRSSEGFEATVIDETFTPHIVGVATQPNEQPTDDPTCAGHSWHENPDKVRALGTSASRQAGYTALVTPTHAEGGARNECPCTVFQSLTSTTSPFVRAGRYDSSPHAMEHVVSYTPDHVFAVEPVQHIDVSPGLHATYTELAYGRIETPCRRWFTPTTHPSIPVHTQEPSPSPTSSHSAHAPSSAGKPIHTNWARRFLSF